MSLRNILADIASEIGLVASNATDRAWLIARVNDAAEELYQSRDLAGSIFEQLFQFDSINQQVSLPSYVGVVRAVRDYSTRNRLAYHDLRPRYQSAGWTEPYLAWREKGKSPLSRNIINASVVVLSIPTPETADFSVVVTGSTEQSARISETITFAVGETEKTTLNAWLTIESFSQPSPHTYDVTMEDIDGNELSRLGNAEPTALYTLIQVQDYYAASDGSAVTNVEVLYKRANRAFVNDGDEFVCPGYDKAIVWKTLEHLLSQKDPARSSQAQSKAMELVMSKGRDVESGVQKSIDFAANGGIAPLGRRTNNYYWLPNTRGS